MSGPKILIIDTYYNKMLKLLDDKNMSFSQIDWENIYDELLLGTGFSYNHYLNKLGVSTNLLVANNYKQYGSMLGKITHYNWSKAYYYGRIFNDSNFLFHISPLHQSMLNFIENTKPDVLFIQDINLIPNVLTSILKSRGIKLIGEIASPLPPRNFFHNFDLVISSLQNLVQEISKLNIRSTFHQLGFDARINDRLVKIPKDIDILFVGSYSSKHRNTIPLLAEFAKNFPSFRIYGNFPNSVLVKSNLLGNYCGEAWGRSMFEVLNRSKIVINRHSSISGPFANNMRMFEVTGVGSLLLTESKSNLSYYFTGDEVATYTNPTDAVEVSRRLLQDGDKLGEISHLGQLKTLRAHTYESLSPKIIKLIESIF